MDTGPLIIPITDFVRRAKHYSDLLETTDLILTRGGRPYMEVRLTNQERNSRLLKMAGAWNGTTLDNDELWAEVLTRHNRNKPITL